MLGRWVIVASHQTSPQDNLIVKPLGKIDFYYVASPRFLAQHEPPTSAEALSNLPGILPNYTQLATTLKPYNSSNNTVMMAQMALTGMGAAILPEWLIEDEIAQGRLVKLFEQPFSSVSIYAVYMNRAFLNLKIRLFIDFLGDNLIKTISVKND